MNAGPVQVWLVDDDSTVRWNLERAFRSGGMQAQVFDAPDGALAALRTRSPDVLLAGVEMPGQPGFDLLRRIHAARPELPVIVMTPQSDLGSAVSAYECGAYEYLPKPFDVGHAVDVVKRALVSRARRRRLRPAEPVQEYRGLLGRAPAMQQVFRAISRLSRTGMTVLLAGEPGTGKELVARALHDHSPRAGRPFAAFNPVAIPPEQAAAELFGRERGAAGPQPGLFETLDGGCLYLEEVGELDPMLQLGLLRVMAEGEIYRIGGQLPVRINVRVIAATRLQLEEAVRAGRFRDDLFHRLGGMCIRVPPLRERREDVPELLDHYLEDAGRTLGVAPKAMDADIRRRLAAYDWPGNVRELSNLCRRLTALAPGAEVVPADLPQEIQLALGLTRDEDAWVGSLARWSFTRLQDTGSPLVESALPLFERTLITVALRHAQGNRRETARLLGWGRNTLARKLHQLDVVVHDGSGGG